MTIVKARLSGRGLVVEMTIPREVRVLSNIRGGELLKVDAIKNGFTAKKVRTRGDDDEEATDYVKEEGKASDSKKK